LLRPILKPPGQAEATRQVRRAAADACAEQSAVKSTRDDGNRGPLDSI
jgi:hypothetical protein